MLELFDINMLISSYGYIGIFIIVFLESGIFFALPGDSLLFSVGLLSASGILNIFIAIPIIFVATFTGALLGYEVGVHLKKLQRYSFFRKILREDYIAKGHVFFDKYGRTTVIFSRFVPIIRTFAPIVAGIVKMHYNQFLRYSLVGSLLWSFSVTLVGYFLGQFIPGIEKYITLIMLLVVALSLLPIGLQFLKKKDQTT